MASLKLNHIYKVYPNGAKAVNDFCMDIEDKEFIVFVGPSGCGKSTTLRMIAGLEVISAGELCIDGETVNDVEPKDRDIAMVFQNYALYPHMSVYDNMAFGLKIRRVPDIKRDANGNPVLDKAGREIRIFRHYTREEIDKSVREAAEILGITDYLKRKPSAMSGGQRQRVALGRAIVRQPKVFLLDEPLSNLDAKLRTQMRSEISKLHQKLQTTFIYVTHDQTEAMTMGTRIVVMKDGFIQQIDTPRNLYSYPVNKFVAGFIGTPQMNFYAGRLKKEGDSVRVTFDNTDVDLTAPASYFTKADSSYFNGEKPVWLGIRLEHISIKDEYRYKAKCRVSYVEDLGVDSQVYADFNLNGEDGVTESATRLIIKAPSGTYYRTGEIIEVSLDLSKLHIFDMETEQSIMPRIPAKKIVRGTVKGDKLSIMGETIALPPAIRPANGEYEIHIPSKDFTLGGPVKAEYVSEEDVNGQRLVRMNLNGEAIYVSADKDAKTDSGITISLTHSTFIADGAEAVTPLPFENELQGKLIRRVVPQQVEDGKGGVKNVTAPQFTLDINGIEFVCPDDTADKIIAGCGKYAFKIPLGIRFSPETGHIATEGIPATVEEVYDYGTGKYALCTVRQEVPAEGKKKQTETIERKIYVAVSVDTQKGGCTLKPEISKIGVYDLEQDIRLV